MERGKIMCGGQELSINHTLPTQCVKAILFFYHLSRFVIRDYMEQYKFLDNGFDYGKDKCGEFVNCKVYFECN